MKCSAAGWAGIDVGLLCEWSCQAKASGWTWGHGSSPLQTAPAPHLQLLEPPLRLRLLLRFLPLLGRRLGLLEWAAWMISILQDFLNCHSAMAAVKLLHKTLPCLSSLRPTDPSFTLPHSPTCARSSSSRRSSAFCCSMASRRWRSASSAACRSRSSSSFTCGGGGGQEGARRSLACSVTQCCVFKCWRVVRLLQRHSMQARSTMLDTPDARAPAAQGVHPPQQPRTAASMCRRSSSSRCCRLCCTASEASASATRASTASLMRAALSSSISCASSSASFLHCGRRREGQRVGGERGGAAGGSNY